MTDVFADVQINEKTCKALMDGGSELAYRGEDQAILLFKLALTWRCAGQWQEGAG